MSEVKFLSLDPSVPADSYWDQAMLKDILKDSRFQRLPEGGAVIVFPGAYQSGRINALNRELAMYKWVILFITSDEESKFPIEKIAHNNITIYVQYPKRGRHDKYEKLPIGYTDNTRKNLKLAVKDTDFIFSGQVTHKRRKDCYKECEALIERGIDGILVKSETFAGGVPPELYMEDMARSKVAICPAGPVSADSFRTYEALEAGCIPVADNISQAGDKDFWHYIMGDMGEVPFPTIDDYADLQGYVMDQIKEYPHKNNEIQAWWLQYKRKLTQDIFENIYRLSGKRVERDITVIVPVSYIKSHPSTEILKETIESIRHQLPNSEILITFDGIRDEQTEHEGDYQEFIRRAIFSCNTEWNAIPYIFREHVHQSGMMREILAEVKTPLLMYVEQDTPLTKDFTIDFTYCQLQILSGHANVIRFHFEAFIPEPHKYLMIGNVEDQLLKTAQWSQRPHLASAAFYNKIMDQYFTNNSRCFLEDLLHGKLINDFTKFGEQGWNLWRVFIYHPEGSIKRSYHTDGRAGGPKYDTTQIW